MQRAVQQVPRPTRRPRSPRRIVELSQASLKLPADAKAMLGDWKNGEKLASIGTGGQIGKIQPDRPGTKQGGNCYACHTIARKEVAAGNLGPALTDYAKVRGDVARGGPVRLLEDLQRAGLLPVLQHAALRPQRVAHAAGDRGRHGVPARPGVAGEQVGERAHHAVTLRVPPRSFGERPRSQLPEAGPVSSRPA